MEAFTRKTTSFYVALSGKIQYDGLYIVLSLSWESFIHKTSSLPLMGWKIYNMMIDVVSTDCGMLLFGHPWGMVSSGFLHCENYNESITLHYITKMMNSR
jgi:hypothetical protein